MYPQQLTEEERIRQAMQQAMARSGGYGPMSAPMSMQSQMAEQLRGVPTPQQLGSPQTPGMPATPPTLEEQYTVAPKPDFTGREGDIANKRALGRSLLAKQGPQGRSVGPSGIYTQNLGEGIAGGLEKALGGYLTAKSGKESKALDADRLEAEEKRASDEAKVAAQQERTRLGERGEDRDDTRKSDREYGEWVPPGGKGATIRGYKDQGVAYQEDGTPMPEGYAEIFRPTRSSGSSWHVMGDTDQYGNQLIVKVDKTEANRPTQVTFSDGTVYDPEKAADYRETTIQTEADEGGRVTASTEQAKVNVEEAENAYKAVQTYEKVERQLGEVTKALDAGAESGPIAKYFPTLTNATTQLMHLRDKMALEEIGEYTFGSLSEAEGDWLKSTSVPDLDEPQLRAWAAKRVEAVQRLGDAARYEEKMRRNNLVPDPDIVTEIKYGGGFTYDDEI